MAQANRALTVANIGAMSSIVILFAAPLVARWEGERRVGYRDLAGIPTSCIGHTGPDAVIGRVYTAAECQAQFRRDLQKHADLIRPCVPASTPVESQAAFLSLAFNIGTEAFCASTLARKLNAGDLAGACAQLPRWVNVKGKRVQGLANRRADEETLCKRGLFRGAIQ